MILNKNIKVVSLFDGMSVAQQALKELWANVETYYASEIDEYAIATTQANHPRTIQLGDVSKLVGLENESIDLLIGGSPCQDLSIAKKGREGLKGARSGLFYEYVRILREVQPKYFILENVASMPKEAKDEISKELDGIKPVMVNAALVSAQNRKRYFWVGSLQKDGTYKQVEIPQPEDKGILLKDILEDNVDEKYFLQNYKTTWNSDKPVQDNQNKYKVLRVGGDTPTIRIGSLNSGFGREGVKSNCLTTGLGVEGQIVQNMQIRKLTPIECLRLQSMPDNYFDKAEYKGKPISNTQRYKMAGNAFNCAVIKHIITNLK